VVESHDNFKNDKDNDDNGNDKYGQQQIEIIPSETLVSV